MTGRACSRRQGTRKGRVALLTGCAQSVLAPSINEATIRLLTRHGIEVVLPPGEGCCGSLVHHMGREEQALAQARANIDAWTREIEGGGLDAIVITASGCGTTIKDYGFMLRNDPAYAEKAARVSALAQGHLRISGRARPRRAGASERPRGRLPVRLLAAARAENHEAAQGACWRRRASRCATSPRRICAAARPEPTTSCSPRSPRALRDRKVANIEATGADVIATGNIGCMTQIAPATAHSDRAHGRAARLGAWRTDAGRARAA